MSPTALKAFNAPSQIGKNGECEGFPFILFEGTSLPSLPEHLLPRRSLKQLPTLC